MKVKAWKTGKCCIKRCVQIIEILGIKLFIVTLQVRLHKHAKVSYKGADSTFTLYLLASRNYLLTHV